jgi:hypothetical protein
VISLRDRFYGHKDLLGRKIRDPQCTSRSPMPESEMDFYSTSSDDTMTFQTDGQGKVTVMILHVDGKDIPVKRIE